MKTFLGYEVMDALDHAVRRARILFTRELVRKGLDPVTWNPIQFTGNKAYTDGTTIWLPNLKQDARVTLEEFRRMQGYALHELGHVVFSDFTTWGETSVLKRMHNAVEDLWEEHKLQESGLISGAEDLFKHLAQSLIKPDVDWSLPGNYAFGLVIHGRGLPVGTDPRIVAIFDQFLPRIFGSTGSVENLQIAREIIQAINDLSEQQEQQQEQDQSADQDQDQNADQSADQSDDQGEGEEQNGDDIPTLNENDVLDGEDVEPSFEINHERTDSAVFDPSHGDIYSCNNGLNEISDNIPARLRLEVRNLFDNTDHSGYSFGHRSGALDPSRLSQFRTDSIFMRREEPDQIDSSCVILVDLSYSMNEVMSVVASTVYALTESLKGIPHCVLGFADQVHMLKNWTHPQERFKALCKKLSTCGGTNDYSANRHAQALLLHRGEKRRVVFVITDGVGDIQTKNVVASGQRLGIQTIGIGIGLSVTEIYPQSIRINDVTELGKATFKQIKLAA